MRAPSRFTRLLLAAGVIATAAVTIGTGPAGADQEIVGGKRVSIADYPYVVYLTTPDGFQFCGGTLVDDDKVVTTAHCAVDRKPADVTVVAGREDKRSGVGTTSAVAGIWVDPAFSDVRTGSDVAVLTLARRLPYPTIDVAGAADADVYRPGAEATILGWGRTAEGGAASRFLRAARVPIMADADCAASYPDYQADSMTCAGLPRGGVDTCQGDSGGPLIVDGKLAGITSWGEGCAEAGRPGVYTRLAAYADVLADQI